MTNGERRPSEDSVTATLSEENGEHEQPTVDASVQLALEALEKLIDRAKTTNTDLKDSMEAGLAPARSLRLRRKSKELETEFAKLAVGSLDVVFNRLDKDGSGTLEPHELKQAFEEMGRPTTDEAIKAAVAALDTDNDGVISFDEFKQIAFKISTSAV